MFLFFFIFKRNQEITSACVFGSATDIVCCVCIRKTLFFARKKRIIDQKHFQTHCETGRWISDALGL